VRRRTIAVCLALLGVGACGHDTEAADVAESVAISTTSSSTTTSTVSPTTTSTSTSTSTSTTTSTSTSTTSTVPATLPNPDNAPADPYAPEPLVQLGTIEIPVLGVVKPMFEGITLTTLDHGPGHWPGSAMPGQQGNVVIAGHRVSHDKPFRYIDRLVAGDDVIFTTGGTRFVYKVTSTEVVQPDALWIVNQSPDYTSTLFACHPAGSTRQRIVVHLAYAPDG
jgi:sortase A